MAKFATFGDITFEVSPKKIYTFDEFTRSGSARWSSHEIINKKPMPEFLGPDQDEITFLIRLSIMHGVDPRKELDKLRMFKDTGKTAPFIIGSAPISNSYWYIESLKERHKTYDSKGQLITAEAELTLKEYPRVIPATGSQSKPKPTPKSNTNNVSKRGHIGIVTVKVNMLNIRSGPSLKARIVKVARKGQSYKVYGTKKTDITWYDVGAGLYMSAGSKYVSFKKV
jgi:phage protein U